MHKSIIKSYVELCKPRILILVLVTATIGYYLGGKGINSYSVWISLLIGTAFVCAGSAVLNHYLEREFDSKMHRTKTRPIPIGKITPKEALSFGIALTFLGLFLLYVKVNILTAFLSLLTSFLYIMVYTPMKRVSWLNTTFGAVPGAIPPLGGWAAATGTLNFDAGMLFLILFIWQHPHFYSIAWMFRDDYKRGGFVMLPNVDPYGKRTDSQILFYSMILIPVSVMPTILGMSGIIYCVGALLSGFGLLLISINFIQSKTILNAQKLLRATVIYLPILLSLIIIDVTF